MKTIENNIRQDLENFGKEGDHRIISDFKKALSEYPEDRDFIISIFIMVIDKMDDIKRDGQEFEKENIKLRNDLLSWNANHQRFGRFLRWKDRGTLEWKTYEYTDEFLIYRRNIDDYFTGKFDDNGHMIFKYPNNIEEPIPPELLDRLKSELSDAEAERLYHKKDDLELIEKDEKSIWGMLKEKEYGGKKEDCIERVWIAIFDLGGIRLSTKEIEIKSSCARATVLKYLKVFKGYGWIEERGVPHRPMWSISKNFIRFKHSI